MERLPTEILQEIMGYLPERDIDSVRLVNHELSAAANVFKYRVLRVCATREGLNHLLYVSQQPELARCVHEIVYPWNLLLSLEASFSPDELEDLEEQVDETETATYVHLINVFLEWYHDTVFAPQLELEDSGECIAALENGLSRMSNIRVLCPGQLDDISLITGDKYDDCRRMLADNGTFNIDDMNLNVIWDFLLKPRVSVRDEEHLAKHFLELIEVSYRVGLEPHKLGTTTCSWPNALWYGFFEDSSGILRNCTPLIAGLTSVSFSLGTFYSDEAMEAFKQEAKKGRMLKFLCSAPNLRSLSLSFMLQTEDPIQSESGNPEHLSIPGMFSLFDIVGRTRIWKHLHTFKLRTRYVNPEELVHFLTCHSTTLRDFEMDVNEVPGGTWRGILDVFNEKLQLTKFKLELPIETFRNGYFYPYRGEELRKMEAYVLREGSPFPYGPQRWN